MGEPYDAEDCPFCGSTMTQSWSVHTRWRLGFGAECRDCGTTWHFPCADNETDLDNLKIRGHLALASVPHTAATTAAGHMQTPSRREPRSGVNKSLTLKRRRRVTENDEYAAFLRRVIAAYSRRVGSGDIDAITDMAKVATDLDQAMTQAVTGLRATGYSWADIGLRLGITRQAAQQRWGGDTS
jgi:hypothetical protein